MKSIGVDLNQEALAAGKNIFNLSSPTKLNSDPFRSNYLRNIPSSRRKHTWICLQNNLVFPNRPPLNLCYSRAKKSVAGGTEAEVSPYGKVPCPDARAESLCSE